jgi:hypothetical protein
VHGRRCRFRTTHRGSGDRSRDTRCNRSRPPRDLRGPRSPSGRFTAPGWNRSPRAICSEVKSFAPWIAAHDAAAWRLRAHCSYSPAQFFDVSVLAIVKLDARSLATRHRTVAVEAVHALDRVPTPLELVDDRASLVPVAFSALARRLDQCRRRFAGLSPRPAGVHEKRANDQGRRERTTATKTLLKGIAGRAFSRGARWSAMATVGSLRSSQLPSLPARAWSVVEARLDGAGPVSGSLSHRNSGSRRTLRRSRSRQGRRRGRARAGKGRPAWRGVLPRWQRWRIRACA